MNRKQRRELAKELPSDFKYLSSPCTLTEAAQIARGVAEDVVSDYQNRTGHVQVAISLQIETLKEILISAGLINEVEFKEKYIQKAEEFNKMQQEAREAADQENESKVEDTPKMNPQVFDIEIKKL